MPGDRGGISRYLGLAQAYRLDGSPGHGSEVFCLVRSSDLPSQEYPDAFFDTGQARQQEA